MTVRHSTGNVFRGGTTTDEEEDEDEDFSAFAGLPRADPKAKLARGKSDSLLVTRVSTFSSPGSVQAALQSIDISALASTDKRSAQQQPPRGKVA